MALIHPPGWSDDYEPKNTDGTLIGYATCHTKPGHEAEYRSWLSARQRCHDPNHRSFKNYGGRGIFVCREWFMNFDAFLAHIGPKPADGLTLDRIDNDRGYEPGNVRWSTASEQQANRRPRSRWIITGGEVLNMPNLTPGQMRTAKAIATRMRAAEERKAATLRERGWVVIPPEAVTAGAVAKQYREAP